MTNETGRRRFQAAVVAGLLTVATFGVAEPAAADPIGVQGAGANDFNGDGRADLTALYDYGNGEAGLFIFPGTPTIADGVTQEYRIWYSPRGNFWPSVTKITSGDFTGDGRNDVLKLYDYGGGSAGLWVTPGTTSTAPDSGGSHLVWQTPRGNWWLSHTKITSGDVDGNGRDDLIALYDYGSTAGLWVFPGTDQAGTNASQPYMVWEDSFRAGAARIAAGDFTGDGRDDVVALYDEGNGRARILVFSGTNMSNPYTVWYAPAGFNHGAVQTVDTDDINGDGVVDFIVITSGLVYYFSGTAGSGDTATTQAVYSYSWGNARYVVGDYDGNGVADVIVLSDDGNGSASLWVNSGGVPPTQTKWWVRVWSRGPQWFWPSVTKVA
nr:VCBS repeat-containing protein [Micromonospora sp. DSM 115978]